MFAINFSAANNPKSVGMKQFAVLCLALITGTSMASAQNRNTSRAIPAAPAAVQTILYARPFNLATGYRNTWSRERELVSSGTLVVLAVDRALVVPRNAAEPVLYAGDRPIQRLNRGDKSGRLVGIVPGVTDITGLPFWFSRPNLPERITVEIGRAERARAEAAGIRPFAPQVVRNVMRPRISVADVPTLLRTEAANLVLRFAPEDRELAASWRLPVARATRRKPQ